MNIAPTRHIEHRTQGDEFVEEEWASLSSVEITRNSKGETQFSVKVYNADPQAAKDEALNIYGNLVETFAGKVEAV